MKIANFENIVRISSLALVAGLAIHCDRGIEPFDPNEEPSQPDLSRIYPDGAKRAAGPMGAGMPNLRPSAGRGAEPSATQPVVSDSGATLSGSVILDDALAASQPAKGMLFIIARTRPTGPPLAVVRVPTPSFPYRFEIGQAQVMIPTLRFEGEIQLSARLDSDGNAMTKLPGDLVGAVTNPLSPGATGVVLVLDQRL